MTRSSARAASRASAEPAVDSPAMTVRIVDVTDEAAFRLDAAVRRPGLRPPLLRLLGGRGPRVEGRPPVVARAGAAARARRARGRRTRSRRTTPSRRSTPSRPAARRRRRSTRSPTRRRRRVQPVRAARRRPGRRRRRRAAQAPAARPRAGGVRVVRQGPPRRRRARGLAQFGRCPRTRAPCGLASSTRRCRSRRCRRSSPASRRRPAARGRGLAEMLVAGRRATTWPGRGFAAVEVYPEPRRPARRDQRRHAGVLGAARVPRRRRRRALSVLRRELA